MPLQIPNLILDRSKLFSDQRKTYANLTRHLAKKSLPTTTFHLLTALSAIISTFALLANSSASLIGAMIIAPLMGPIIGFAFGVTTNDLKLMHRAAATLVVGSISVIVCSMLIASGLGITIPSSEILSRTNPTLIDLGIAIAAGIAGAVAHARKSIDPALAGVAIAVALVPPLSVVGIGLASPISNSEIALGAGLLYLTNLSGMIFAAGIVFLFQGYSSWERARNGFAVLTAVVLVVCIPLFFSLTTLIIQKNLQHKAEGLINSSKFFKNTPIEQVEVFPKKKEVLVNLRILSLEDDPIEAEELSQIQQLLAREIEKPVTLNVRLIPIQDYQLRAIKQTKKSPDKLN
ncbi:MULTISPECIES: TIGR00341 family protein [unclassified Coleofasciculus]|uniref:TIGR00341 family protein n=1 Tax=unclassified Coleofasciculus TaxID=2692782 RepID=UPI00188304A4|nr:MULTISPECIES: TIGR00341 family protein [unclassified Coleofasciculus]MBE9124772.1 TIGR00341 family protein [Coleofasciculus sp. LEGE 07081]MBE9148224.1 TIGR00341 family protein [Coleofasciculus sp. LEGE 07092]